MATSTIYASKFLYTPATSSYLTNAKPLNTTQYIYLPDANFTSSSGNVTTIYDTFNPVTYLYLNPELARYSNIETVEDTLIYYQANDSPGLMSNIDLLPPNFDYKMFNYFNSNIASACNLIDSNIIDSLRSNGDVGLQQLSVISYLRYTSNLIVESSNNPVTIMQNELKYNRDPLFNPSLYRLLQNVTRVATDDDIYNEYITRTALGEPVMGKPDDFRLAVENYHSSSLHVYSNLTVRGDTFLNGLRGSISNVDIIGNFKVSGTIFANNLDFAKTTFRSLYIEGNSVTSNTGLTIKQVGTNAVMELVTNGTTIMLVDTNGFIGISTDGVLPPEANLDVNGDAIFRNNVNINSLLTVDAIESSTLYNSGTVIVDDLVTINGGCIVTSPEVENDPTATALTVTGAFNATQYFMASDQRIKTDIRDVDVSNALDIVRRLHPCDYKLRGVTSDKRSYGLLGQELEELCPQLVSRGPRVVPDGRQMKWCGNIGGTLGAHLLNAHGMKIGDRIQVKSVGARASVAATVVDVPDVSTVVLSVSMQCDAIIVSRHIDDFVSVDYIQIISLLTTCVQVLLSKD